MEKENIKKLLDVLYYINCTECPLYNRCQINEGRTTICNELQKEYENK